MKRLLSCGSLLVICVLGLAPGAARAERCGAKVSLPVLKRKGELLGVDIDAIMAQCAAAARRVMRAAEIPVAPLCPLDDDDSELTNGKGN